MSESSEQQISRILRDVVTRRESGDPLTDEEVLAAHPELRSELTAQLTQLRLIGEARNLAALAEQSPPSIDCGFHHQLL